MQPAELPPSCCGDGVCNAAEDAQAAWWADRAWPTDIKIILGEDDQNCPIDCSTQEDAKGDDAQMSIPKKRIETTDSTTTVFGTLQEVVHDTYHCEDTFNEESDGTVSSPCSPKSQAHRPSQWLEELVLRDATLLSERSTSAQAETFRSYRKHSDQRRLKNYKHYNTMKTNNQGFSSCRVDLSCDDAAYPPLPFSMPAFGSQVVEFGAGLGQDTRNLARAGYQVLGVEVSGDAVAEARALTVSSDMDREALDRWSYINYDALALPKYATRHVQQQV